jgi:hypothetical protein
MSLIDPNHPTRRVRRALGLKTILGSDHPGEPFPDLPEELRPFLPAPNETGQSGVDDNPTAPEPQPEPLPRIQKPHLFDPLDPADILPKHPKPPSRDTIPSPMPVILARDPILRIQPLPSPGQAHSTKMPHSLPAKDARPIQLAAVDRGRPPQDAIESPTEPIAEIQPEPAQRVRDAEEAIRKLERQIETIQGKIENLLNERRIWQNRIRLQGKRPPFQSGKSNLSGAPGRFEEGMRKGGEFIDRFDRLNAPRQLEAIEDQLEFWKNASEEALDNLAERQDELERLRREH